MLKIYNATQPSAARKSLNWYFANNEDKDEMPHDAEKGIKRFGKIITCYPSIYIMGHPGLTVLNFTDGKFHRLEGLTRSKNSALMDIYTVNPELLGFSYLLEQLTGCKELILTYIHVS